MCGSVDPKNPPLVWTSELGSSAVLAAGAGRGAEVLATIRVHTSLGLLTGSNDLVTTRENYVPNKTFKSKCNN